MAQEIQVARLLVLGAKQVGKSAVIVRYTTGRYIHHYSQATNHWLARRRHSPDRCVELLEQRDLSASSSSSTSSSPETQLSRRATSVPSAADLSLADRVAQDQQVDLERQERQELLEKLAWANAYVVLYSIDSAATFNQASKYLSLIQQARVAPLPAPEVNCGSAGASNSIHSAASTSRGSTSSGGSGAAAAAEELRNFLGIASGNSSATSNSSTNASSAAGEQVGCAGCRHNHRRPILLLANKCDLATADKTAGRRQVSAAEGRALAIRHQAMFAEVSVAETRALLESCLAELIEQIEPTCLHRCHFSGSCAPSVALTEWRRPTSAAAAGSHCSAPVAQPASPLPPTAAAAAAAPIWASLVRCAPLVAGVAVHQAASVSQSNRVQRARPQVVASLRRRVSKQEPPAQHQHQKQPRHSTSSEPGFPQQATQSKGHPASSSYLDRYESLKSSFRTRASLARANLGGSSSSQSSTTGQSSSSWKPIAGGGGGTLKSSSGADIKLARAEFCEPITAHVAHRPTAAGWLRSHIRGSSSSSVGAPRKSQVTETPLKSSPEVGATRQRRPLFRYRNRRKTVAFEPVGQAQVDQSEVSVELESLPAPQEAPPSEQATPADPCTPPASDPGGSDYSSKPATHLTANQSANKPQAPDCALGAGRKRYHLVKTMQATLSNFTKLSHQSPASPHQNHQQQQEQVQVAAKRSFCNSLFRNNNSLAGGPASLKKVSQPALKLAQVEYIPRRESTTVGFCS